MLVRKVNSSINLVKQVTALSIFSIFLEFTIPASAVELNKNTEIAQSRYLESGDYYDFDTYNNYEICTSSGSGAVNVREGPGTNYPKGLVQVGSGGNAIDESFRNRNYTLKDGSSSFTIFSVRVEEGSGRATWANIGNNQWEAWVRSDFVCRKK